MKIRYMPKIKEQAYASTHRFSRMRYFHRPDDKNGYNLGKLANFQEVFGDDCKLWFLPDFDKDDHSSSNSA
ncbi:palmitoyltransferase ZDHHC2-like [Glossina fuscipes]|uniref:Palmitoyltransferase ZDHHC2-like n=1 Tax=Glossina fuscipes TaxID=7396 RepID=A0A9C5Z9G7_9MUSC|nr:palmitoyltransferase ZDHHC2-like [Glossina fuscipes]